MRSRALQVCRPLRLTSKSRLQCLVQQPFTTRSTSTASSSPTPSSSASESASSTTTTTTTTTTTPAASSKPTPAPKSKSFTRPANNRPPTQKSPPNKQKTSTNSHLIPGPSASEIDVASARQIPTPSTNPSAFVAALSTSPIFNGNGNGMSPANPVDENGNPIDWSSSFHGLATVPFSPESAAILQAPLNPEDVEVKPDGIVYLPEIKYRRILNQAFGPGGWGLAPRGELVVGEKVVTREYALVVNGRFVAQSRGECQYFSEDTIPTAGEGCKSNALMRCCKDLGIASELWDPRFLREFKKQHAHEVWVEHVVTKKRRQIWKRKDCDPTYPFQVPGGQK